MRLTHHQKSMLRTLKEGWILKDGPMGSEGPVHWYKVRDGAFRRDFMGCSRPRVFTTIDCLVREGMIRQERDFALDNKRVWVLTDKGHEYDLGSEL